MILRRARRLLALLLAPGITACLSPSEGVAWPRPDCPLVPRAAGVRRAFFRSFVVPPMVIRVYDGDTFRVGFRGGGETIRLRGIDTPEVGEPGSAAASWRLAQLLGAGPVTIAPHAQDVYCRTVADVFVAGERVADILRREGHAKPHPAPR